MTESHSASRGSSLNLASGKLPAASSCALISNELFCYNKEKKTCLGVCGLLRMLSRLHIKVKLWKKESRSISKECARLFLVASKRTDTF